MRLSGSDRRKAANEVEKAFRSLARAAMKRKQRGREKKAGRMEMAM